MTPIIPNQANFKLLLTPKPECRDIELIIRSNLLLTAQNAIKENDAAPLKDKATHKKDFYDALKIFFLLADDGDKTAKNEIESLLFRREFHEYQYECIVDMVITKEWQSPEGLYTLGKIYEDGLLKDENGSPIEENLTKAMGYWEQAAKLGHPEATYNIGLACFFHEAHKDEKKAHEYFLKAAQLGCPPAFFCLAETYMEGIGTQQDDATAQLYYRAALALGEEIASEYIHPD